MRDLPRLVRHGPWVIAGCYLVVALAWILLSDAALDWLGLSEDQQRQWQTWKGIAYVLVTALLLLGGCVWIQHRVMRVLRWLRDSESTYRTLFEDNPNPMWIYDPASLRFLRVNQAAQRLYGFSADEFAGMTIRDIRPPQAQDDLDRVLESLGA
ncbi:MAG: PAS domain-containing protein, partial [Gammaproteobacteria bacterium]|nr:PAS domain-containing protein [Gammaproteobacteria bacterium]